MLLIQLPQELLSSILTVADFQKTDLLNLALSCHSWASLTLPILWRNRRFNEVAEIEKFKKCIQRKELKQLYPYGTYIKAIEINETKDGKIVIDSEIIKFLADNCSSLIDLDLGFSAESKVPHWKLPLHLLSDRLKLLHCSAYEHLQGLPTSLEAIGFGMLGWLAPSSTDETAGEEDAICALSQKGHVKTLKLLYPNLTNALWEDIAKSSGNKLENVHIRIKGGQSMEDIPSIITGAMSKYCHNLRAFELGTPNCPPMTRVTLMELIQSAPKLKLLDLAVASDAVQVLHEATELQSLYLFSTIEGGDFMKMKKMETLEKLSILKIEGVCEFKFLENLPNLQYLKIDEFQNLTDSVVHNIISRNSLKKIILVKIPNITDRHLTLLASMPSLTKFEVQDRLPNVTSEGWLSLVQRPPNCPSWQKLSIVDGRQINQEFFKVLNDLHPGLLKLWVSGINLSLYSDHTFEGGKFNEAWQEFRNHRKWLNWPVRGKK